MYDGFNTNAKNIERLKKYYVCSRRRRMVMQTGLAGRPNRKTNIKDSRRQPTLCMRNLEVRDRRLRRRFSRFAKPRGNNSDEGKRRTSIAASCRPCERDTRVENGCASKLTGRANALYAAQNGFIDH